MNPQLLVFLFWMLLSAPSSELSQSEVDVAFDVRKIFGTVSGTFQTIDTDVRLNHDNLEKSEFYGKAHISTISTGNAKRDNHIQDKKWFDTDSYTYLEMRSTGIEVISPEKWLVTFDLTIKDHTQQVQVPVFLSKDNNDVTLRGEFTINRQRFDVGTGSLIVGSEVNVRISFKTSTEVSYAGS